ncbi:hypothetical protein R8871_04496 [Paraburkholderia graminis C4D1M]|nr:hypothetical protein R8871_04496 [Paraburkholderia graminis C4D1M]
MYAGAGQTSRQCSRENTAAFHTSKTSNTSNAVERIAATLSRSPSP